MNLSYCAAACIVILFGLSGFSSSSNTGKDDFNPKNCTIDEDCSDLCFKGGNLFSRCDLSVGVCICDCSDASLISSSYTSACDGRQPDGHWRDFCDSYCTQEYRRPCRYCNDSDGMFTCTCVCSNKRNTQNETTTLDLKLAS